MRTWIPALLLAAGCAAPPAALPPREPSGKSVRVAAIQPKSRLIPAKLGVEDALARMETTLDELTGLLERAAREGCRVAALPEDTLGLGDWEASHPEELHGMLARAVPRMLERLGRAAAALRMTVVCCNDAAAPNGRVRNTAFLIGPDGRELGRYDKVGMPLQEQHKERGATFPVFATPDLGVVGMLICYDMVFPEGARCLALGGADVIFHPTLGGAAIGDDDISRAAFRTRAVENFVYLVVSQRGSGSMILSPQGRILAEAQGPDSLAVADIDPFGGREGGDSMNRQTDMRARLFRERVPAAYGILNDPSPPALERLPEETSVEQAVRVARSARSEGEARFNAASKLQREGRRDEAVRAYETLCADYPRTWIDTVSRQRLKELR